MQSRIERFAGLEDTEATQLNFTADPEQLRSCNVFIVSVPTPVDSAQRADLTPLIKSSETVGKVMPKGAIASSCPSRRHRRNLRPAPGKALRPQIQPRLLRRLHPEIAEFVDTLYRSIGVDPYYLTHKAQEIGYHPEVILAVAHPEFLQLGAAGIHAFGKPGMSCMTSSRGYPSRNQMPA